MSTEQKDQVTQAVINNIEDTKPQSKQIALSLTVMRGFFILCATLFSGYLLTLLFIDLRENTILFNLGARSVFEVLFDLAWEVLLLVIVIVGSITIIYRQTDWPLVNRTTTVVAAVCGVLLISTLLLSFVDGIYHSDIKRPLDATLEYRRKRFNTDIGNDTVIVFGRVTKVDTVNTTFVIENRRESVTVRYTDKAPRQGRRAVIEVKKKDIVSEKKISLLPHTVVV